MNNSKNKPELLAPAGNLLSAIVAFESGADAVYVGLGKFNARERAENFSLEDLSKLINYARQNSKKVYVTFNTLIKESELEEATLQLAKIAELGPDAVIVQDLGIVRLVRELFPNLKIHASTQMAIHNSNGVKVAQEMGIERVILERQVTKEELKEIVRESPIEIEVFVHGALCCSLSGRCLFSSWLGGWSGNRGKCTQPCRRRFYGKDGNGFFFSTKDLGVPEMIPELLKMGVASFKIEGRLKKPDYIKNVVTAYRTAIDSENVQESASLLRSAIGRQLSQGFYTEKSMDKLIVPGRMGVTGMLCGKVIETMRGGFMASVSRKIHVGDILRLQQYAGDNSSALAVSTIKIDGKIVPKAVKGETCFIQCDREVPEDASIYKTGESFDKMSAKLANLKSLRNQIDLDIRVTQKEITVKTPDGKTWTEEVDLEAAQKHPLSVEKVEEAFRSSNSDEIAAGEIKVDIDGDYFMPASVLKQIRRSFWGTQPLYRPKSEISEGDVKKKLGDLRKRAKDISPLQNSELFTPLCPFVPEGKLKGFEKRISGSGKRLMLTSIFQIPMISKIKDVEIKFGFPLPICNSLAVQELLDLTQKITKSPNHQITKSIQAWIELEKGEIRNLIKNSPLPVEMITEGCIPILVSRAEIPADGKIKDDRGAGYYIEKDKLTGITYIYPDKYFKIKAVKGAIPYKLNSDVPVDKTKISTFNFERELV